MRRSPSPPERNGSLLREGATPHPGARARADPLPLPGRGWGYFSASAAATLSHGNEALPKWPFFAVGR